jgi:hypothetical protein
MSLAIVRRVSDVGKREHVFFPSGFSLLFKKTKKKQKKCVELNVCMILL